MITSLELPGIVADVRAIHAFDLFPELRCVVRFIEILSARFCLIIGFHSLTGIMFSSLCIMSTIIHMGLIGWDLYPHSSDIFVDIIHIKCTTRLGSCFVNNIQLVLGDVVYRKVTIFILCQSHSSGCRELARRHININKLRGKPTNEDKEGYNGTNSTSWCFKCSFLFVGQTNRLWISIKALKEATFSHLIEPQYCWGFAEMKMTESQRVVVRNADLRLRWGTQLSMGLLSNFHS